MKLCNLVSDILLKFVTEAEDRLAAAVRSVVQVGKEQGFFFGTIAAQKSAELKEERMQRKKLNSSAFDRR
jgi:hypothetical protein